MTTVRIMNTTATHLVMRARRASAVLDLFRARKVSEPPKTRDRPALLPDCHMTMATRARDTMKYMIDKTSWGVVM